MDIGNWTLVAWIAVAVTMLVFLKVCLSRICSLSCEDLSCVRDKVCEKRDA
jgi:hypothetical protein